jgi:hypothetical protein
MSNRRDQIVDVSEKVIKKIALRLADETPFISKIKSKLDADISSKESGNQKQKVIDNCMLIQHIVAYLNTGNPEILNELNDVFSGVGNDGKGNRIVRACDLNDVSYREAIDDRVSTIKKFIPKRKQSNDGNVPYKPTSEEFDNPERSDGRLVFHNPNLGQKTKKRKPSKRSKKRPKKISKKRKKRKSKSNKRKRLTTRR